LSRRGTPKSIHQGFEARRDLLIGASILAAAVSRTFGPHAGTAILERPAGILATKDGVAVAREIHLAHPVQNLGARTLLSACVAVGEEIGDGTSTAAIVGHHLARGGHRLITAGHDLRDLLAGIREGARFAKARLHALAADVADEGVLEHVALLASNHDAEVARVVTEAVSSVGKGGTVVIEEGQGVGLDMDLKDGFELDRGMCSPYFADTSGDRIIEGALVAVVGRPLTTVEDVASILEESSQWPQNDLLVVAPEIRGQALTTMAMNDGHSQGAIRCVGIADASFHRRHRHTLDDLAALSQATVVDPVVGYDHTSWKSEWFGTLRKVQVGMKRSLFTAYDEAHDTIQAHVAALQRERDRIDDPFDLDQLQNRIAKMQGGFCVVRAGGVTSAAMKERMGRIEDTLSTVQAALREGILPGGGAAYLDAADALERVGFEDGSYGAGQRLLAEALRVPVHLLARNAGYEPHRIIEEIREARSQVGVEMEPWVGFDALQGVRDLGEKPFVVDAALVSIVALGAAMSAATTLLTAEVAVHDHRR